MRFCFCFETSEEFYGTEDLAMHNVDVMTDASAFTAFTRYTAAPTASAASRTTKRSSRSKRKMERKVGSGRKGTVDEEEYLLKSLTKLASRLVTAQGNVPRHDNFALFRKPNIYSFFALKWGFNS
jgi:elongator complex protein 1